jgi:hypothetical protein
MSLSVPERLLKSLGIEKPEDIDLEAVAWSLGAKVKYRPLKSCEARICGYENKATISVDDSRMPQRQRFSLAHEIGHWIYHRGQLALAIREAASASSETERTAKAPAGPAKYVKYRVPGVTVRFRLLNIRAFCSTNRVMISRDTSRSRLRSSTSFLLRPA